MLIVILILVVGLLIITPLYGVDSRDGQDWRPLKLPSVLADTSRPPLRPAVHPHPFRFLSSFVKQFARVMTRRSIDEEPVTSD